jgi:hypothetical protein
MAGGVPEVHRTDSLSAAFNNLAEQEEFTRRYSGLREHYAMRSAPGSSRCPHGAPSTSTNSMPESASSVCSAPRARSTACPRVRQRIG